jgi:protoporphyrinogen oxidase
MIYDIIIVGGGMAGLYTQYKLMKKYKNKKILLIEKDNRLGGRVYTHKVRVNGIKYSMEAGAGRFNDNHKYLKKLINELGLKKQIFKIPSKVQHIATKKQWKNNTITKLSPYDYFDFILKNTKLSNDMKKMSFDEWLKKNVNIKVIDYLKAFYPYKDVFKTNAYDALNLYSIDLNINNNFYVLGGGLMQLVDGMSKKIKSVGGKIKLNTELRSINDIEDYYIVKTNICNYFCKNIVLTGQRPDLLKIKYLNNMKSVINSVRNASLCRFYFIFDTKKCVWFKNIKKTITDSKLSYFIPINYETGLLMISYVDEHNALYLKKLEKGNKNKLINFLLKECERMFGIKNIPKPIWTKSFFWENGVGDWKKGNDSKVIEKIMTKPYRDDNIFICGENYSSRYQCWIEGALETSENVLKLL